MTDTPTTGTELLPEPARVGERARAILVTVEDHPLYKRLTGGGMRYADCWATFTGYPQVSEWSLEDDAGPLLTEALRVLALKAAVYELTDGDEQAAELLCAAPVDEMVHAVIAQHTIMTRMQNDLVVLFPHATELERFDYEPGGYTDTCYQEAGWGEPPRRYWIGGTEATRRLAILNQHYQQAGLGRDGRSHNLTFTPADGEPELTPVG